jgi:hypothetical protein
MTSNTPEFHDPTRAWIAILGMGAGGARFFSAIIDRIHSTPHLANAVVLLFEDRPETEFGRGVAWSSNQSDLFRANMRLPTIGLREQVINRIHELMGFSGVWDRKYLKIINSNSEKSSAVHCTMSFSIKSIAENMGIPVVLLS